MPHGFFVATGIVSIIPKVFFTDGFRATFFGRDYEGKCKSR